MSGIIIAAAVVGITGILIGIFLGVAGDKFKVEVDQKEVDIRAELPGNNCGGCGYAGCDGLAAAIAKGEAPVNACPVGGAPVGAKIAAIMGTEVADSKRMTAFVKCAGDCNKAKENYYYSGVKECTQMPFVPNGGSKACTYGCMGYGSCVKACEFDAIHLVRDHPECTKMVVAEDKFKHILPYQAKRAVKIVFNKKLKEEKEYNKEYKAYQKKVEKAKKEA